MTAASRSVTAASRSPATTSRSTNAANTSARKAAASSGRLGKGSRGTSITHRILRGRGGFGNPPNRLNPRPVEAIEQRGKLHRRERHHPVHDRRPAERTVLQLLPDQHQAAAVPDQDLHPVAALGAVDNDRTRKWVLPQHFLRQGGEAVATSAEVNRPRRQQNARASRDGDHGRSTEARTARSTAVSWASSSSLSELSYQAGGPAVPEWRVWGRFGGVPSRLRQLGTPD